VSRLRVHAALGEKDQRPDVARSERVGADRLVDRGGDCSLVIRQLTKPERLRGVDETGHVIAQPEHRRSIGRVVAPDTFEHPDTVVKTGGQERHRCLRLRYQPSVHPVSRDMCVPSFDPAEAGDYDI
jgi:hypothetical protein